MVTLELNERNFTLTMIIDLAYDCSYILYNFNISQQLYFCDQNNIFVMCRCINAIILLCTNRGEIYQKLCLYNYWILFILTQSFRMSLLYTLKTKYIKSYIFIIIEFSLSLHNHHPECHCYAHSNCSLAILLLKFKGSNPGKVESKSLNLFLLERKTKVEKILGRKVTCQISAKNWCYSPRL